jgi:hypothetical protein
MLLFMLWFMLMNEIGSRRWYAALIDSFKVGEKPHAALRLP